MLSARYADKCGVRQEEVDEALELAGLSDKAQSVKFYYNGYTTVNTSLVLYNPWSILLFLDQKRVDSFWAQSGNIGLLGTAILSNPAAIRKEFLQLLEGATVNVPFEANVSYEDLPSSIQSLWSLLYFSGYITGHLTSSEPPVLAARVPNFEAKQELALIWRRELDKYQATHSGDLIVGLFSGDRELVEENLRELVRCLFSIHDLSKKPEVFYHGFLFGVLIPLRLKGFGLKSNREAGLGRYDILITPPEIAKPAVIIEIKTVDDKAEVMSDSSLQAEADVGLKQIQDKEYFKEVSSSGRTTILWGIAVAKKFVAVAVDVNNHNLFLPPSK